MWPERALRGGDASESRTYKVAERKRVIKKIARRMDMVLMAVAKEDGEILMAKFGRAARKKRRSGENY